MAQRPAALPMVPAWVDGRLRAIVNAVPAIHFEHSMYGPLTAYLHTFFPPNQCFMIKPQGMLRPENHPFDSSGFDDISTQDTPPRMPREEVLKWVESLDLGDAVAVEGQVHIPPVATIFDHPTPVKPDTSQDMDEDEDEGEDSGGLGEPDLVFGPDTSFMSNDSYGVGVKHTNKGIRYPDFIIVKATESLDDDKILLVVEVKKNDDSPDAARLQIRKYLKMAANKRRVRFLQGVLIMAAATECYFLDDVEENPGGGISDPTCFLTTSTKLKARLHKVATANW